jgi:hypothetical protein
MQLQEVMEGDYRIFVGALESPLGDGYTAALVVRRAAGSGGAASARDAFRDDSLACGHRWATADDAMSYALRKARALIRGRPA